MSTLVIKDLFVKVKDLDVEILKGVNLTYLIKKQLHYSDQMVTGSPRYFLRLWVTLNMKLHLEKYY